MVADEGLDFLKAQRGRHFDPKCVDAFLGDQSKIQKVYSELAD